ncbi:ATP-binding protein [Devosia neptuniae]|jgi:predicted kinase|uniref:AAA family ATPase n=1 Tax=Devosia TaxID=46913 RepID=UPI0022AFDF8B|nr:ATP-binding protein [Devosia neptuniae]MCZ4347819.1 ATP-binding protein [Devosia neptuniae]|tara:strand:- start:2719 stop:3261 length:543 start_codon:yes stop_codon:yes gene_type:complete
MSANTAVLHLVCGKIAAGKSTLVTQLGQSPNTIIVREDHWLAHLYPGELHSLADYARSAAQLRGAIAPHLIDLLGSGVSVVLDFPANTLASRAWMRTLFEAAGCAHRLHYLDVPDAICKVRLRHRNASGEHEFTVSDETFDRFTSHFVPPSADEGFDVVRHNQGIWRSAQDSQAVSAMRQ